MTEQPPRNTKEKIDHWFDKEAEKPAMGAAMAQAAVSNIIGTAAKEIIKRCPEGPELNQGLLKLREASMWFMDGIAVNPSDISSTDGKLVVDEP